MNLRSRLVCLLAPLVLLAAGEAGASAPAVSAVSAVSAPGLVAPAAGCELTAGSLAVVEWEGQPPLVEAEEWEAFLSLDGGRTHPLRITPHLDLSIRRFTFRVPAFPTRDARLLLRFGDERREVEVEPPHRFVIVPGVEGVSPTSWISLSKGERARPGDEGVVFWVEGARDGSGLREVMAAEANLACRSVETGRLPWLFALVPSPQRAAFGAPAVPFAAQRTPLPCRTETGPSPSAQERPPVRLLISRFNE
jgi:hypothetical protein